MSEIPSPEVLNQLPRWVRGYWAQVSKKKNVRGEKENERRVVKVRGRIN